MSAVATPKGWEKAQDRRSFKNLREISKGQTVESWKNKGIVRRKFVEDFTDNDTEEVEAFYGYTNPDILVLPVVDIKKEGYSNSSKAVYDVYLRYPHAYEGKGRSKRLIDDENYEDARRMAMAFMRMTEGDISYADWRVINSTREGIPTTLTEEQKRYLTVPEDWRTKMMRSTFRDTGY